MFVSYYRIVACISYILVHAGFCVLLLYSTVFYARTNLLQKNPASLDIFSSNINMRNVLFLKVVLEQGCALVPTQLPDVLSLESIHILVLGLK